MKATSIKQIKFNRGQVSDLLSERMDMGLQNACGTVYDNIYINRYGQLEPAPMIKLASNGVAATSRKLLMLFDTGEDLVIPVGLEYTSTLVNYYGWQNIPSINIKVVFKMPSRYINGPGTVTQNCTRNVSGDYSSGGVNYYAWKCNKTISGWARDITSSGASVGYLYEIRIDNVYTTTPTPSAGSALTVPFVRVKDPREYITISSKSITSTASRRVILTKSDTPNTSDEVFDSSLNYIGQVYQFSNSTVTYNGSIYYRYSTIDTTQGSTAKLFICSPLSKSDNTIQTDLSTALDDETFTVDVPTKYYQFGYNVVLYDQNTQPVLFNILPGVNGWYSPQLTLREKYFDNSFDSIYVRGTNIDPPTDFTVPTSGYYLIPGVSQVTTESIVTVTRSGVGGDFTQSLVGQVIQASANGGVLQVKSVDSATQLKAYVLSPLTNIEAGQQNLKIPFDNGQTKWVFGYEKAYGDTEGLNNTPSYPDSVIYANQRLIFGGNDYHGNLISASRIGVLNDFDPESATESDAFTTAISSKDFCRIVDFVVSNGELRIACTNGEYAMSLGNLTPTGSLNGFDLRSEVGVSKNSFICDCGGLTAYVSSDGDAVYGTQFQLLRDRFQPVSLTSQTSGIVDDCKQLVYLRNRLNNEGNLLVGLNSDGSLFGLTIDTNSGLVACFKMKGYDLTVPDQVSMKITKLFGCEYGLWGLLEITQFDDPANYKIYLVRFARNEFFCFPSALTIPTDIAQFIGQDGILYRGLVYTDTGMDLIAPVSTTDNLDGTTTVSFGDADNSLIVSGFLRQSDWRSVEIGIGMATRELNKNITKLGSVVEPQEFWNWAHTNMLTVSLDDFKKYFNLTRGSETHVITEQFDASRPIDLYGEGKDMIWRRAFENPTRETIYGFTAIAPFLVKSITATVEYDEVS